MYINFRILYEPASGRVCSFDICALKLWRRFGDFLRHRLFACEGMVRPLRWTYSPLDLFVARACSLHPRYWSLTQGSPVLEEAVHYWPRLGFQKATAPPSVLRQRLHAHTYINTLPLKAVMALEVLFVAKYYYYAYRQTRWI